MVLDVEGYVFALIWGGGVCETVFHELSFSEAEKSYRADRDLSACRTDGF